MMDFHTLKRRDLQSLCKKNKIPGNLTNIAMADALKALESATCDKSVDFHSLKRKDLQFLCKKNNISANLSNSSMANALKALDSKTKGAVRKAAKKIIDAEKEASPEAIIDAEKEASPEAVTEKFENSTSTPIKATCDKSVDFHSLKRKDLQFLCKKNDISANLSNSSMANALKALDSKTKGAVRKAAKKIIDAEKEASPEAIIDAEKEASPEAVTEKFENSTSTPIKATCDKSVDFHSLKRKDLQFLCKKNDISANLSNSSMANALKALDSKTKGAVRKAAKKIIDAEKEASPEAIIDAEKEASPEAVIEKFENSTSTPMNKLPTFEYKLLIVGEKGTGKTSFLNRHLSAVKKKVTCDGIDVYPLDFITNHGRFVFRAWDSVQDTFMINGQCAIRMFDVTCGLSYQRVKYWHHRIRFTCGQEIPIVICGNKVDVVDKQARPVAEAQQARTLGSRLYKLF